MADNNQIQGLPAGVTLDSTPHDAAPIQGMPAGVTLDSMPHDAAPVSQTQTQTPPVAPPAQPSLAEKAFATVPGSQELIGAGKGLLDTTSGIGTLIQKGANLIQPGLGDKIIPPSGLSAEEQAAQTHGVGQAIGKFGENVGEWMAGEEGLKALGTLC